MVHGAAKTGFQSSEDTRPLSAWDEKRQPPEHFKGLRVSTWHTGGQCHGFVATEQVPVGDRRHRANTSVTHGGGRIGLPV
jgi:hypothetical protein